MNHRFLDKIQLRLLTRIADSDFLVHFRSLGIDLPQLNTLCILICRIVTPYGSKHERRNHSLFRANAVRTI
jgi:hypothetical protein